MCMKGGVHCFAVFFTLFIPLSLCFCFCLDRWSIVVVMHCLHSMSSLPFCASRDVSLHRLSIWNDARRRRRHQTMLDIAVQGVRLLHSWFCVHPVFSPFSLVSFRLQTMRYANRPSNSFCCCCFFPFSCLFSKLKRRTARRTLRVENPAACVLPMPRAELVQKLLARQANVAPTVFLRFAFYGWGVMWKNMGGEFFLQSVCFRFFSL